MTLTLSAKRIAEVPRWGSLLPKALAIFHCTLRWASAGVVRIDPR